MTDKINGRTPEEIKHGLEYCISESVLSCDECPYAGKPCDSMQMLKDALAYIQQLEAERDAAVLDLEMCCSCEVCTRSCKYDKVNAYAECADFEWRGPEVE